eukprot:scaffold131842_cov69-Phaeocystis_antarctica.AAC.1
MSLVIWRGDPHTFTLAATSYQIPGPIRENSPPPTGNISPARHTQHKTRRQVPLPISGWRDARRPLHSRSLHGTLTASSLFSPNRSRRRGSVEPPGARSATWRRCFTQPETVSLHLAPVRHYAWGDSAASANSSRAHSSAVAIACYVGRGK